MGKVETASVAAPGRDVQSFSTVNQAAAIPLQHLVPRQEVMTEGNRLRHLKVGEAGHDGVGMLARKQHNT